MFTTCQSHHLLQIFAEKLQTTWAFLGITQLKNCADVLCHYRINKLYQDGLRSFSPQYIEDTFLKDTVHKAKISFCYIDKGEIGMFLNILSI